MIYYGDIVRSPLLTPPIIHNHEFERLERNHAHVDNHTSIMVRKCKRSDILFHYITTRLDDGFVRRIIMFHCAEDDPMPVDIDEQEYDKM